MKRTYLLSLTASLPLETTAQVAETPNIIWIMTEDIGPDLECYGMKGVHTPVLNQMTKRVCFSNQPIAQGSQKERSA